MNVRKGKSGGEWREEDEEQWRYTSQSSAARACYHSTIVSVLNQRCWSRSNPGNVCQHLWQCDTLLCTINCHIQNSLQRQNIFYKLWFDTPRTWIRDSMRRKQKQINDCYNNILEDFYLTIKNDFFLVIIFIQILKHLFSSNNFPVSL